MQITGESDLIVHQSGLQILWGQTIIQKLIHGRLGSWNGDLIPDMMYLLAAPLGIHIIHGLGLLPDRSV